MIIAKGKAENLANYFNFHLSEHEVLAVFLLKKISPLFDFKLKIQKASIQLIDSEPFSVIGFRRSQKQIFLEFYNELEIKSDRIVKAVESKNGYFINRVNIAATDDVDTELLNWINESFQLINV